MRKLPADISQEEITAIHTGLEELAMNGGEPDWKLLYFSASLRADDLARELAVLRGQHTVPPKMIAFSTSNSATSKLKQKFVEDSSFPAWDASIAKRLGSSADLPPIMKAKHFGDVMDEFHRRYTATGISHYNMMELLLCREEQLRAEIKLRK